MNFALLFGSNPVNESTQDEEKQDVRSFCSPPIAHQNKGRPVERVAEFGVFHQGDLRALQRGGFRLACGELPVKLHHEFLGALVADTP